MGAFTVHDLHHVYILGEHNENVLGGHGEPDLYIAFVADEIFLGLPGRLFQCRRVGDTYFLVAGQKNVHIRILCVAFPNGLFLGHRLIVKAVDKGLVAVDIVAALVQLAEIRAQQMMDGGIQAAAHAQITSEVLALCIDQKITLSNMFRELMLYELMIAWAAAECNRRNDILKICYNKQKT